MQAIILCLEWISREEDRRCLQFIRYTRHWWTWNTHFAADVRIVTWTHNYQIRDPSVSSYFFEVFIFWLGYWEHIKGKTSCRRMDSHLGSISTYKHIGRLYHIHHCSRYSNMPFLDIHYPSTILILTLKNLWTRSSNTKQMLSIVWPWWRSKMSLCQLRGPALQPPPKWRWVTLTYHLQLTTCWQTNNTKICLRRAPTPTMPHTQS